MALKGYSAAQKADLLELAATWAAGIIGRELAEALDPGALLTAYDEYDEPALRAAIR